MMVGTRPGYEPYEPQLSPVAWAEGVWTVDGPEAVYKLSGLSIPCPTRMTIVRLADGSLWIHSPVAFSAELSSAVTGLGPVAFLVAPSSYHHLHIEEWAVAYPQAQLFSTPDLVDGLSGDNGNASSASAPASWNSEIVGKLVDLGTFKEVVFFHRASRTLIVTDLMQNFEAGRVRSILTKFVLKAGGATGPNARPSIEIRHATRRHRDALRAGVEQMIAWQPTRIILSHGKCFDTGAIAEIRRAFAWLY